MSTAKPTILLVHGAWHGSWCWEHQKPELEALGYPVATVDLPCTSSVPGTTQFDDAAHIQSILESLLATGKQVIVLAHSYAGPIGSAAIASLYETKKTAELLDNLLGLIVLCGYIFPSGMDQGAVIRDMGGLTYVTWDSPTEGLFLPKNPSTLLFTPDVPADRIEWALLQLQPQSTAANTGIVPPQIWQNKHWTGRLGYIRCTADAVVPLAQQDGMIDDAGGRERWLVRTLDGSGHSPFLSRPQELAGLIHEISKEFGKKDEEAVPGRAQRDNCSF